MKHEAQAGISIPLFIVHKRVTIMTSVLETTLYYIVEEGKDVDIIASAIFTSIGKSRPRKRAKSEVYCFEKSIYNFTAKKERPVSEKSNSNFMYQL
jgi:hypothetical protein